MEACPVIRSIDDHLEFGVIGEGSYCAVFDDVCDIIDIDNEQKWAQNSALWDSTGDLCRAGSCSFDHNMLGSVHQETLNTL